MVVASSYANFADPMRLALRMLRTGTKESTWPLVEAAASAAAKPFDMLSAQMEPTYVETGETIPQVLIVGAPRTGSTFASQILAQGLDVSYFPNVSSVLPSAPIWITQKWMKRFDDVPQSTRSFFGNTTGLRGISDGFAIWNRWLGDNRYRIEQPPNDSIASMRAFFDTWSTTFQKPLLNKNNRNVDGIETLSKILPHAFFVVCDRDPLMVVQSLLGARQYVQGKSNHGWGLFSDAIEIEDELEAVCRQYALIEERLEKQLQNVDASRICRISYERMCDSADAVLERVCEIVPGIEKRTKSIVLETQAIRQLDMSLTDQRRATAALERFRSPDAATLNQPQP